MNPPHDKRNGQISLQEVLCKSAESIRRLVDQMPAVLWATDRDLRLTASEGSGLADVNLRPGEVVGESLFDHHPPDDPKSRPVIEAHRRALRGETVTTEIEYQKRTFFGRVQPLRGPSGKITGCIGLAFDVTEQKELKEALAEQERLARLDGAVTAYLLGHDARAALQACVEELVRVLSLTVARIWTLDRRENALVLQASAGTATDWKGWDARIPVGHCEVGVIAQERQAYMTNAVVGIPGFTISNGSNGRRWSPSPAIP